MYIEYAIKKNEGGSRILSVNEDLTNYKTLYPARSKALCENIHGDLVKIVTAQGYSGALASLSLSNAFDGDRSDSACDGSYDSFLSLEYITDADGNEVDKNYGFGVFDSKFNGWSNASTYDGSPVGKTIDGDGVDCGYTCYTFLRFDTSEDASVQRYKYLFFQVIVQPDETVGALGYVGGNAYASIQLYTSMCNDIGEIDVTKIITTKGTVKSINATPSIYKGKSSTIKFVPLMNDTILNQLCSVASYNTKAGMGASPSNNNAVKDGRAISVIFMISMSKNHLYIAGKTVQDVHKLGATPSERIDFELTRYHSYPFVMSKYKPVDYWYVPELKTELKDYITWVHIKTFDGMKSNVPNGQSMNMFVTSNKAIKQPGAKNDDPCLCKWSANAGLLSNGSKATLYNNVVADKNKSEAVLLFGLNVTTTSPSAVMTGLFSSINGIYGVYGDGLAFGDVIAAVNSNNELVNMKILPHDYYYQSLTDSDNATGLISGLKIAVPYG
jgi:hypothetical protein